MIVLMCERVAGSIRPCVRFSMGVLESSERECLVNSFLRLACQRSVVLHLVALRDRIVTFGAKHETLDRSPLQRELVAY